MELLNSIQQKLKVPKSQFNKFGNFSYRNAEDILEAVKPLLDGGVLTLSDEIVSVDGRFYVKATARITFKSGAFMETCGYAREALDKKGMDEAQITGAASSYARKYALNGLFCIDDTKDADSNETEPAQTVKAEAPDLVKKKRDAQKKMIKDLCDEMSDVPLFSKKDYEEFVKGKTALDLGTGDLGEIITRLEALK